MAYIKKKYRDNKEDIIDTLERAKIRIEKGFNDYICMAIQDTSLRKRSKSELPLGYFLSQQPSALQNKRFYNKANYWGGVVWWSGKPYSNNRKERVKFLNHIISKLK